MPGDVKRARNIVIARSLAMVVGVGGVGLFLAWRFVGAPGPALPLQTIASIALPGTTGRLDYESLDATGGLLAIAHLGDNALIMVDIKRAQIVATIPDLRSVRGVLIVPSLRRVYAAAQGTRELVVIDEDSLKIIDRVEAGDVDGIAYAPQTHQLFVSDESGSTDVVIDTNTDRVRAHISLGGQAGNTQYDAASQHIFVAVQTRNRLAEIDPKTLKIVRQYELPGCLHAHGVQLDGRHGYAYVACQYSSTVVQLDLRTGTVAATSSVGLGADVLAMDFDLRRLYVASETGIVTVFDTRNGSFAKIGQSMFAPQAHVVCVDQTSHRVYFPLANVGDRPVLRIAVPTADAAI